MKIIILAFLVLSLPIMGDYRFDVFTATSQFYSEAKSENPEMSIVQIRREVSRKIEERKYNWRTKEAKKAERYAGVCVKPDKPEKVIRLVSRGITFQEMALNSRN